MSKKILLTYLSIVIFAFVFAYALPFNGFAQSPTKEDRMEARATIIAERQTDQLTNLKSKGDKMITDRISSLQRLLTRVQNDKKLSSTDKSNLINDINSTIDSLNSLKTKIDADTDVNTARTDVKSIVTTFRIFVIFEPKIRVLITINNLQTQSGKIATLSGKVQNLINQLKSQGKDITNAQNSLNDINTLLSQINTTLATDKTLIGNVNVNSSDPQSVFVQVRKDLADVRSDFAKIRSDFASMRDAIRIILPKGSASIKPSSASESGK